MGLVGVGGVGNWEMEALKELHGARWQHDMTIIVTPLYGGSPPPAPGSAPAAEVHAQDFCCPRSVTKSPLPGSASIRPSARRMAMAAP